MQQIFTNKVPVIPRLDLREDLGKNWKNSLQTWNLPSIYTPSCSCKTIEYRLSGDVSESLNMHSGLLFASKVEKDRVDEVLEMWNRQKEQNF